MADRAASEAYVTLATNDAYGLGALVLSQSLRITGTSRKLVVMITAQVSQSMRDQLVGAFDAVVEVDILDSGDSENLALLTRPDLGLTFTKLHCWRLTQYTKCVFMDADTLVLQNIDDLFDCDELAAAPDVGWPDCFNSGVFVFVPSPQTYASLLCFAVSHGSFDGGDQGLLNQYFSDWSAQGRNRRLPFTYNTVAHTFYSYAPAFKQFGQNVKVVHFIGAVKPWHAAGQSLGGASGQQPTDFLQLWWRVFMDKVHHRLNDALKTFVAEARGPDATPPSLPGGGTGPNLNVVSKHHMDDGQRQYNWERGQIDYLGADSFENILRQLDKKIVPPSTNGHSPTDKAPPKGPPPSNEQRARELKQQAPGLSTDRALDKAPPHHVHRTTVSLPRRVYNEFAGIKTLPVPRGTVRPKSADTATAKSPTGAPAQGFPGGTSLGKQATLGVASPVKEAPGVTAPCLTTSITVEAPEQKIYAAVPLGREPGGAAAPPHGCEAHVPLSYESHSSAIHGGVFQGFNIHGGITALPLSPGPQGDISTSPPTQAPQADISTWPPAQTGHQEVSHQKFAPESPQHPPVSSPPGKPGHAGASSKFQRAHTLAYPGEESHGSAEAKPDYSSPGFEASTSRSAFESHASRAHHPPPAADPSSPPRSGFKSQGESSAFSSFGGAVGSPKSPSATSSATAATSAAATAAAAPSLSPRAAAEVSFGKSSSSSASYEFPSSGSASAAFEGASVKGAASAEPEVYPAEPTSPKGAASAAVPPPSKAVPSAKKPAGRRGKK